MKNLIKLCLLNATSLVQAVQQMITHAIKYRFRTKHGRHLPYGFVKGICVPCTARPYSLKSSESQGLRVLEVYLVLLANLSRKILLGFLWCA